MSNAVVGSARAEKIDRWVMRSALATVLHNVGTVCEIRGPENVEDVSGDLDANLFNELWPVDDDSGPVASARCEALAASILVQLATGEARDYLLKEGARLATLAATHLEETTDDA